MIKQIFGWVGQIGIIMLLAVTISVAIDWRQDHDFPTAVVPKLQGCSIQGEQVDLKELSQDQPVLVYFWSTWCNVCDFVTPAVDTLAHFYPVVSVTLNSGNRSEVKKFLKHHDYSFPVLNDPIYQRGYDWSVKATPTIFVVKDGKVKDFTTGFTTLPGLWRRMAFS